MHAKIKETYIDPSDKQKLHLIDLGLMDYDEVLEIQKDLFNEVLKNHKYSIDNYIVFCEHHPVFTIGKSGNSDNLLNMDSGIPLKRIGRGGDITFHGPGQLVVYPILNLSMFHMGLKTYVEKLQESIIQLLEEFGLKASSYDKQIGVWLDIDSNPRKICSIGIKCSRFITMHGFALNVNTDLSYYENINPCGINDKSVTSIEKETGQQTNMESLKKHLFYILKSNLGKQFLPLQANN